MINLPYHYQLLLTIFFSNNNNNGNQNTFDITIGKMIQASLSLSCTYNLIHF